MGLSREKMKLISGEYNKISISIIGFVSPKYSGGFRGGPWGPWTLPFHPCRVHFHTYRLYAATASKLLWHKSSVCVFYTLTLMLFTKGCREGSHVALAEVSKISGAHA